MSHQPPCRPRMVRSTQAECAEPTKCRSRHTMAGDKGFKAEEGMQGDGEMKNERGQTGEGDHGWAPDSGKASEAMKQAGDKAFHPDEAEAHEVTTACSTAL